MVLSCILSGLYINNPKKELLSPTSFDRYGHSGPERVSDLVKMAQEDFPSGSVGKNPSAIAGDIASISGMGRFHMLQSS